MNSVYIATSLDGFIADRDGGLDWLHSITNPDNIDMGWTAFMARIDALVMGRVTFETVCGFDVDRPYTKPVFVLSDSLNSVPTDYADKVEIVCGPLLQVVEGLNARGFHKLYIDGGQTVQSFLAQDLIDELIITQIPILLGGGYPLFGGLPKALEFKLINSEILLGSLVQSHYKRLR